MYLGCLGMDFVDIGVKRNRIVLTIRMFYLIEYYIRYFTENPPQKPPPRWNKIADRKKVNRKTTSKAY